ncbi:histidine phosphatase family protein [Halonotius aquaticus]|uniref:Histidine phosphatase family protein n=1 Tax=Halonotius aquaticus TaxID=2216978 RepID=A0A3A6PNB4_9EURY|nr:histidine phosphatase family protein [Halonotius aquaticus]RJX43683.1 histidine phosphatase family protein [Halonotius aquaticus]
MATLVAVRHGETMWNREQRVQGWAPVALTETGRRQADALAATVTDQYAVDRLISSDLRRTLETARPLGRAVDCEPTPDRRWRERDFGVLQGLSYGELFLGYPEFALTEVGYTAAEARPEGGESLIEQRDRIIDALTTLVDDMDSDETVVVVTHGGPLYLLLGWIKNLDIVATIMEQEQGNCAINEIEVDTESGRLAVQRENDTRHVDNDT